MRKAQENESSIRPQALTYNRLLEVQVDSRKKLTANNDPVQHATFVHLPALREGEFVN
jgi:hypothetical protein